MSPLCGCAVTYIPLPFSNENIFSTALCGCRSAPIVRQFTRGENDTTSASPPSRAVAISQVISDAVEYVVAFFSCLLPHRRAQQEFQFNGGATDFFGSLLRPLILEQQAKVRRAYWTHSEFNPTFPRLICLSNSISSLLLAKSSVSLHHNSVNLTYWFCQQPTTNDQRLGFR